MWNLAFWDFPEGYSFLAAGSSKRHLAYKIRVPCFFWPFWRRVFRFKIVWCYSCSYSKYFGTWNQFVPYWLEVAMGRRGLCRGLTCDKKAVKVIGVLQRNLPPNRWISPQMLFRVWTSTFLESLLWNQKRLEKEGVCCWWVWSMIYRFLRPRWWDSCRVSWSSTWSTFGVFPTYTEKSISESERITHHFEDFWLIIY